MELLLNGEWQFKQTDNEKWMPATVPGCNYLDLLNNGEIDDPFVGTNEKDAYWVSLKDWEYKREFNVDEQLLGCDKVELYCDMLDTICDVYVNDVLLGSANNCHRRFTWNVKERLNIGQNVIRIVFFSPVNYVKNKQAIEKCPPNNNGQNGIPHIRKPQCHFGWDWGPVLPPSGISGNIGIIGQNGARVTDFVIKQHHADGKVTLDIAAEINMLSEKYDAYTLTVTSPNGERIAEIKDKAIQSVNQSVLVENPQLWWTHELNPVEEQPLYAVTLTLTDSFGNTLDYSEKKIGLRTIELDLGKDEYGSNFRFILNGVPIFAKGANWIPADSFINRYTPERLEYDIKAALFSNMNMLRIWGGGYYESDAMYDLCDKYGILLWQDFPFACQAYPFFDESFTDNVKTDIEYNVKRLRHHASLALWCGNNEIETMSIAWRTYVKYVKWTDKFFYHILPEFLKPLDDVTAYIPGTPCGVEHLKGFDRDNVGDTHLWAVWHGLQAMTYYRKRLTRFCSEFGFESLPDIKTIERFAKAEDYSLTSPVFLSHQKCLSGNMKMIYYIASRFRLPKKFEDYIYLSQISQQECIKDATEHWRRNKGRCNGSLYWQMNDCWPVCSWAGMDYYGNYKALQYTSRHFFAPIEVSIQDEKKQIKIYAINDTLKSGEFDVVYAIYDYDGKQIERKNRHITLESNQSAILFDINRADIKPEEYVLSAELYQNGELINRKTYLPKAEKNLHLPKAKCEMRAEIDGDTAYIYLKSDKFMRLVRVESNINTLPFSDNYFDLYAGAQVCITQKLPAEMDREKYLSGLSVRCIQDVEPKGSRIGDKLMRLKVILNPVNLASYVYDHRIPKDLKL